MVFSFARVTAALGMKVEDYYTEGRRAWFRLHEQGGKRHGCPPTTTRRLPGRLHRSRRHRWSEKKPPRSARKPQDTIFYLSVIATMSE
jgi:hypothetical protein